MVSSFEGLSRSSVQLVGDAVEATAQPLPHRSKYLLLVNEFLRRYLELVDQVERDFAAEDPREDRTAS